MKKIKILPITLIAAAALIIASVAYASPAASQDFGARLIGAEEVPPRNTDATGVATFQLSQDETALSYTVSVADIENVFAAHIHCGAKRVNGPVGVTLFMGPVGGGAISGTLAKGTITAPDPGNACGWADLAAVVAAMNTGNTYVNVHTNDGVAPTNTGPGDFPGGEIRGQITQVLGGAKGK
ncbi:MAG TPA: CHRD domain-containing protein [Anaerolineales bacterium]|nr:CHRD domain-containing protein [Anaerolineales bacterium]